jgi:adenylyltransferase/sulfurtransferase
MMQQYFPVSPMFMASIFRYEGTGSCFQPGFKWHKRSQLSRHLSEPSTAGEVPACEDAGVLGVLPGIIGTMQALEIIKLVAKIGDSKTGVYHMFDAVNMEMKSMRFSARADNPLTGTNPSIQSLQDYDLFCGLTTSADNQVKQITQQEFVNLRDSNSDYQLIDVREAIEYQQFNIGGVHIPLSAITENVSLIRKDIPVIIHCQTGQRSMQAIMQLQSEFQFTNLLNLEGGIVGLDK